MDLSKIKLTRYIIIGMFAGIAVGAILSSFLDFQMDENGQRILDGSNRPMLEHGFISHFIVDGVLEVIGSIFIRALKMLVVPLVFVSLVCGAAAMDDIRKLGTVGVKTFFLYLGTTCLAISIALAAAYIVKPGQGIELSSASDWTPKETVPLVKVIVEIIPSNVIQAFSEARMLQIIVFALLFGIGLVVAGDPGKRVLALFQDLNEVIMKLVVIVMLIAPVGVFAKMAQLVSKEGFDTIFLLAKYFVLVLVVLLIHGVIVYPVLLKVFSGLNPITFFKKLRNVQLFAFGTASSNATIPVSLRAAEDRLGVDNKIASFTIPLGATINMDGTAIMQGVATLFIAQMVGEPLAFSQLLVVVATATLASIGTAGVPSAGLIMLVMVLDQVGLPATHIGMIIGIDRILDMTRTAVNVTGDAAVTCIVANSENQLDVDAFNRSMDTAS